MAKYDRGYMAKYGHEDMAKYDHGDMAKDLSTVLLYSTRLFGVYNDFKELGRFTTAMARGLK